MASYVYLLKHATDACLKIGKADDIHQRAVSLGRAKFDFDNSWAVRVPDEKTAYRLERTLGHFFLRFHVDRPAEADGRTEWYDTACFTRALALLEREADLFDGAVLRVSDLPVSRFAPRSPSTPPKASRRPPPTPLSEEARIALNDHALSTWLPAFDAFASVSPLFAAAELAGFPDERRLLFVAPRIADGREVLALFEALYDSRASLFLDGHSATVSRGSFYSPSRARPDHLLGHLDVLDLAASKWSAALSTTPLDAFHSAWARLGSPPAWLEAELHSCRNDFFDRLS